MKEQLEDLRHELGLSLTEFSTQAGLSYTTYYKFIKEDQELGMNALKKLAKAYDFEFTFKNNQIFITV